MISDTWLANCEYADLHPPIQRYKCLVIFESAKPQALVTLAKNCKVPFELDSYLGKINTILESKNIYLSSQKTSWKSSVISICVLCICIADLSFCVIFFLSLLLFLSAQDIVMQIYIALQSWQICMFEILIIVRHHRFRLGINTSRCSWCCSRYNSWGS